MPCIRGCQQKGVAHHAHQLTQMMCTRTPARTRVRIARSSDANSGADQSLCSRWKHAHFCIAHLPFSTPLSSSHVRSITTSTQQEIWQNSDAYVRQTVTNYQYWDTLRCRVNDRVSSCTHDRRRPVWQQHLAILVNGVKRCPGQRALTAPPISCMIVKSAVFASGELERSNSHLFQVLVA
jgi:hypothetical protein